jgi:hypothetical protein
MKRWGLGTNHGLRRKHVDTYLEEFVFRNNRRFYRHLSFETCSALPRIIDPVSYWDIAGRANPRKGDATIRQTPRRRKTATECDRMARATRNPRAKIMSRDRAATKYGRTWDNGIMRKTGAFSIAEWCRHRRVSVSMCYKMKAGSLVP